MPSGVYRSEGVGDWESEPFGRALGRRCLDWERGPKKVAVSKGGAINWRRAANSTYWAAPQDRGPSCGSSCLSGKRQTANAGNHQQEPWLIAHTEHATERTMMY